MFWKWSSHFINLIQFLFVAVDYPLLRKRQHWVVIKEINHTNVLILYIINYSAYFIPWTYHLILFIVFWYCALFSDTAWSVFRIYLPTKLSLIKYFMSTSPQKIFPVMHVVLPVKLVFVQYVINWVYWD